MGNKYKIFHFIVFSLLTSLCTCSGNFLDTSSKDSSKEYTVLYDGNDSTSGTVPIDSNRYSSGDTVLVLGNTGGLENSGYSFAGWCEDADCTGTSYTQGKTFKIENANITLYAKWTSNPTYTITYDGNGETTGSAPIDTTNYEEGISAKVIGNTGPLIKMQDGISLLFEGWNTLANGNGITYLPDQSIEIETENIVLYAIWSILRGTGPAGGLIFYDKGNYSDGWRYLEAAPDTTMVGGFGLQWGAYESYIGGTGTAIGTGQANTTIIVSWLNSQSETGGAARYCDELVYDSYSDWFLPSSEELNQLYINLKLPGVGGLENYVYWSSSESGHDCAWAKSFVTGQQGDGWDKSSAYYVCAVRAFGEVVGVVPTVSTSEIKSNLTFTPYIAGTSARGGGYVSSSGTALVIDRGVCWNSTGAPTLSDSTASDGIGQGIFTNCNITGLAPDTTYYVRAYATNSGGTTYGDEVSFYSGKTFGTVHEGGLVFYNDGDGHGLVTAPESTEWQKQWGKYGTLVTNTETSLGTGSSNTIKILTVLNEAPVETDRAAQVCDTLTEGGYSDWFLPSKDELNLMYLNLKANGFGGFIASYYWSSSEYNADGTWSQRFSDGYQSYYQNKNYNYHVRAIRAY